MSVGSWRREADVSYPGPGLQRAIMRSRDLYAMKRYRRDWWGESRGRVRKRGIGIGAVVAGWPLFVIADALKCSSDPR